MAIVVPRTHHLDRRVDQIIAAGGEGSDDDMLAPRQVCAWFGVSHQWLALGRSRGWGPPYQRLSNQVVRYRRGDVKAWLAARTHSAERRAA